MKTEKQLLWHDYALLMKFPSKNKMWRHKIFEVVQKNRVTLDPYSDIQFQCSSFSEKIAKAVYGMWSQFEIILLMTVQHFTNKKTKLFQV
jgi:hypothetical protein